MLSSIHAGFARTLSPDIVYTSEESAISVYLFCIYATDAYLAVVRSRSLHWAQTHFCGDIDIDLIIFNEVRPYIEYYSQHMRLCRTSSQLTAPEAIHPQTLR